MKTLLQSEIDADVLVEKSRAEAAELVLSNAITGEATARANADIALDGAISAEEAARIAADNTLTADLATEVTRAKAAEQANADNLVLEVNRANAAEAALQSELDNSQAQLGLDVGGNLGAWSSSHYILTAASMKKAIENIDAGVKSQMDMVQGELDALYGPPQMMTVSGAIASQVVLIDAAAAGGDVMAGLPAADSKPGQQIKVKRVDTSAHVVRLAPAAGEFLEGLADQIVVLDDRAAVTCVSDGTKWWII